MHNAHFSSTPLLLYSVCYRAFLIQIKMRNCCQIISQMIEKIPTDKTEFIKDLQWNYEDASYKAPEETLQWHRTQSTLIKHIPKPSEDWEFEVLSIFTTQSVEDIRSAVQNAI